MSKPTLLVLAAGMGSRYGGLKQMDAFGPNGETLLDYSIYDAIAAGYGKVVFVIRESFNEAFRNFFKGKFEDLIDVDYVFQDIHDVPKGIKYDPERTKPWGTAHAVWVTRNVINEPFVVINADDFYGREAYEVMKNYFDHEQAGNYALLGYQLEKTLSEYGTVNRGVCATDDQDQLLGIVETLKIGYEEDGSVSYPVEGGKKQIAKDTTVSMNFWGFYLDYFDYCTRSFAQFLETRGFEEKSEFFIPLLIEELIKSKEKEVDVLECSEEWFGVTYKEDKPFVQERIRKLIEKGTYPRMLW